MGSAINLYRRRSLAVVSFSSGRMDGKTAEKARAIQSQGFRAIKLKFGTNR